MSPIDHALPRPRSTWGLEPLRIAGAAGLFVFGCGISACTAVASPDLAASLTRSVDVNGAPADVWAMIGSFCAIADWHPAIAKCTEDGKAPSTRTLVTKDGKATFVELETARSDVEHRYSYTFTSAPVPVTNYSSTLGVTPKSPGISTVTWAGAYTSNSGNEKDAADALSGIYESGLAAIKARLQK